MNENELQEQSNDIISQSKELVIFNSSDNECGNNMLKTIKLAQKSVKGFFNPMVDTAYQAHKIIASKRKSFLDPLVEAEGRIKSSISKYLTTEREEREAQEREIREEAEKKEKIRLAKIAEREEELKKAADYLSPEQIAEEQRKIEEANKKEFAPTIIIDKPEKVAGQVVKTLWKAEVTDKALVPEEYKIVDESALGKIATALKDKANVSGVRFYSQISVSTR